MAAAHRAQPDGRPLPAVPGAARGLDRGGGDHLETAPDTASLVLDLEESRDRSRHLRRLLEELTADQRRCLVLRFLEGRDIRRTAEALGRSEGAVKVLQHRAMSAVRRASAR